MTTKVQKEADAIDCVLCGIESRLSRLDPKPTQVERKAAYAAEQYVGMARSQVRLLMSERQRRDAPY